MCVVQQKRPISKIGFWPNLIPLKRTGQDFQTIPVPFHLVPFQKNLPVSVKDDGDERNRPVQSHHFYFQVNSVTKEKEAPKLIDLIGDLKVSDETPRSNRRKKEPVTSAAEVVTSPLGGVLRNVGPRCQCSTNMFLRY
jgi:hypothetical protein